MTARFSHLIPVSALPAQGRDVTITANADERRAIAEECGLRDLKRFYATFRVTKGAPPLLAVQGKISADVVQTCGVSLEPVDAHVGEEFALTFTLDPAKSRTEVDVDPGDEDPPEPVSDGQIDFGALAIEHLVLNLDPYPRASNATYAGETWGEGQEGPEKKASGGPFAALSKLVAKDKGP